MSQSILQDFSPSAIIAAIEQNFAAFTATLVRSGHGEVHEEPELTWVFSGTALTYYNGVFRTHLPAASADATIQRLLHFFQTRQQVMSWWVTPSSRPDDLAQRLEAHGLQFKWDDAGMAVDLQNITSTISLPPSVQIEQVQDEETWQAWFHAFELGYDVDKDKMAGYKKIVTAVPLAQHPVGPFYLARLNGEPVATSALYCGAGVAGVYEVSTVPSARRQGIGAAITLAPLLHARALGYRIAILQASPMGEPVYRRLGFTHYCTLAAYNWRPS